MSEMQHFLDFIFFCWLCFGTLARGPGSLDSGMKSGCESGYNAAPLNLLLSFRLLKLLPLFQPCSFPKVSSLTSHAVCRWLFFLLPPYLFYPAMD